MKLEKVSQSKINKNVLQNWIFNKYPTSASLLASDLVALCQKKH